MAHKLIKNRALQIKKWAKINSKCGHIIIKKQAQQIS